MRIDEIRWDAWDVTPSAIPTKMVPDFEALFNKLEKEAWLVLQTPPIDHRTSPNGSLESKLVKDFKNWTMNNKGLMLNHRHIGQYRWYIVIGRPCPTAKKRQELRSKQ